MSKFDKSALYVFGTALIIGLYFVGFQILDLKESLENISGQLWSISQLLDTK